MTVFIPFDLVILSLEFYPKDMTGRINKLAVRGSSVKGCLWQGKIGNVTIQQ